MSRVFVVSHSSVGKTGGTYHSENSGAAAKKAGRQQLLYADKSAKASKGARASPKRAGGGHVAHFTLVEVVGRRRSAEGHAYKTTRTKKRNPTVFQVGGREVVSMYDYTTVAA